MRNVLWRVKNLSISFSWRNAIILCGTNNLNQDTPEDAVDIIIKIGHWFKEQHHQVNVFICGLLPRDEYAPVNCVYIVEPDKILKVKHSLNKLISIDQDNCWTQLNGCLNSDMFYLAKLYFVEKGNLVLANPFAGQWDIFIES